MFLRQYTDTSLIFKSTNKLIYYVMTSKTYKVFCILLIWYKHSNVNNFVEKYLTRNSSLKHSRTYGICSKLFSFFDRLLDRLFNFGICCGKSSYVISFVRDSFKDTISFQSFGVVLLFFSIGFGVTSMLLGNFEALKAVLIGMGILISLLLLMGKARWAAYLKSSIFWRFAVYIFD